MKANHAQQTRNKSSRQNQNAALATAEWYQEFVRHVELRNIAPRTRVSYLAWVRRLHEAMPKRDITALTEGEVLDFIIALRHERDLKDSTINQAVCALRGFYRDHLGRDWKAWNKIKIHREEQLPNILSRAGVEKFLNAVHSIPHPAGLENVRPDDPDFLSNFNDFVASEQRLTTFLTSTGHSTSPAWSLHSWRKDHGLRSRAFFSIERTLAPATR